MSSFDIGSSTINTEVPYFPGLNWPLTQADFGKTNLWVFNWIQAFWDTSFSGTPGIVIANSEVRSTQGDLIASFIPFAYPGERVNVKGNIILATGVDRRGNTINSIPINPSSPGDSLLRVYAWGGNY